MNQQIGKLLKRFEKVEELLGHVDVLSDQKQYRELLKSMLISPILKIFGRSAAALKSNCRKTSSCLKAKKTLSF